MQQPSNREQTNPRRRTRQDYRRKRISKRDLTLDWARTNVELTDRKRRILDILKTHHLMTIEQLEYLHPDFGHQSQSHLLLRRDINKLHEIYFLDKALKKPVVQWDGSIKKTMAVAMGELGSQYAGWLSHYDRIKYQGNSAILPKTAHHTLRIHDAEIETRKLLATMNVEIKAWAFECGNQIVQHKNKLNPDAFCMLHDHQNDKYYTFFLEYDTGKDDFGRRRKFPRLEKKIDRYQAIKHWSGWYEKPISSSSENKFPYLFFVTEEPKRFPELPKLFATRTVDHVVCMQQDYLSQLTQFIQKMRAK